MLPRPYAQTISPGGEIGDSSVGPSITLDRYGSIYVADSGSHKVQKFNGAGKFLAGWVYMSKPPGGSRGGESSSQSSIPGLGL